MIPPHHNAAFVANMEDVLAVYQRPYDPARPVICMDERPVQLVHETRTPLPAKPGRPRRIDYEYERAGTATVFLCTEPLGGWRRTRVRARRTAVDWAEEMRGLLEDDYADAATVVLVCDNLNTHTPAAFYQAFPPAEARRLVERLEIHYTPKHGSWLNVAECELSVLSRQCLQRRLGSRAVLTRQVRAWERDRNARQRGVDWHFTTADARIKLTHLYPQVQLT